MSNARAASDSDSVGDPTDDGQLTIRIPNPKVYMARQSQWKGRRGKPRCDHCRLNNLKCDRVLPTCNHCSWATGRECRYTPLPTPAHRGIPRCDRCRLKNLKCDRNLPVCNFCTEDKHASCNYTPKKRHKVPLEQQGAAGERHMTTYGNKAASFLVSGMSVVEDLTTRPGANGDAAAAAAAAAMEGHSFYGHNIASTAALPAPSRLDPPFPNVPSSSSPPGPLSSAGHELPRPPLSGRYTPDLHSRMWPPRAPQQLHQHQQEQQHHQQHQNQHQHHHQQQRSGGTSTISGGAPPKPIPGSLSFISHSFPSATPSHTGSIHTMTTTFADGTHHGSPNSSGSGCGAGGRGSGSGSSSNTSVVEPWTHPSFAPLPGAVVQRLAAVEGTEMPGRAAFGDALRRFVTELMPELRETAVFYPEVYARVWRYLVARGGPAAAASTANASAGDDEEKAAAAEGGAAAEYLSERLRAWLSYQHVRVGSATSFLLLLPRDRFYELDPALEQRCLADFVAKVDGTAAAPAPVPVPAPPPPPGGGGGDKMDVGVLAGTGTTTSSVFSTPGASSPASSALPLPPLPPSRVQSADVYQCIPVYTQIYDVLVYAHRQHVPSGLMLSELRRIGIATITWPMAEMFVRMCPLCSMHVKPLALSPVPSPSVGGASSSRSLEGGGGVVSSAFRGLGGGGKR